jgi:hypothetical protein
MTWAGFTTSGKKSPLIFVEEEVLPWLVSLEEPYVFMQNGAPAHTSRISQKWLEKFFNDFLDKTEWPPSSPDLNPMDLSIWGIMTRRSSTKYYSSVDDLKRALIKIWDELSEETIRAAVAKVPQRLRQVIKAKGGHIENVSIKMLCNSLNYTCTKFYFLILNEF